MEAKDTGIAMKLAEHEMRIYEVGKRAGIGIGIRIVVEWLENFTEEHAVAPGFFVAWRAQCKEWGYNE